MTPKEMREESQRHINRMRPATQTSTLRSDMWLIAAELAELLIEQKRPTPRLNWLLEVVPSKHGWPPPPPPPLELDSEVRLSVVEFERFLTLIETEVPPGPALREAAAAFRADIKSKRIVDRSGHGCCHCDYLDTSRDKQ